MSGVAPRAFSPAKEVLEKPLGGIQKVSGDEIVLRLSIADRRNRVAIEIEDDGPGVSKENRRMGRDEKLCMSGCGEIVDNFEERQLPLWRQRRLWFVQDVNSLLEPIREQRKKRFAMRLRVERLSTVRPQVRYLLDVGCKIVEALGAQKESFGHLWEPGQPQRSSQCRTIGKRGAVMIAIPAFRVESAALGQCFEERRFAAAVLADEQRHRAPEFQIDAP